MRRKNRKEAPKPLNKQIIKKGLKLISQIRNYSDKTGLKIANSIIGTYGEFQVAQLLLREFPKAKVYYKSGHHRYDLLLQFQGKEVRIEVKTSTLKNEGVYPNQDFMHIKRNKKWKFKRRIYQWGWRFGTKNKKGDEKFDFAALITLHGREDYPEFKKSSWKIKRIFWVPASVLRLNKKIYKRFTNVKRGISFFEFPKEAKIIQQTHTKKWDYAKSIKDSDIWFNNNYKKYGTIKKLENYFRGTV
ncbi:MAG: hypothetical protein V1777_04390 [Candidatus Micrarchaeota archaeon]